MLAKHDRIDGYNDGGDYEYADQTEEGEGDDLYQDTQTALGYFLEEMLEDVLTEQDDQ